MQRIREYLQQQAAEKSLHELIDRVREGVDELNAAALAIPEDRVTQVPPIEEGSDAPWTPLDCLKHALGSNAHVGREVLYVAHTGELPPNEDDTLPETREELLKMHAEAIESACAHVVDADPEANLDVKWQHPMFGDLNWKEWFIFLRIHSRDHARQLKAMVESFGP
jgi:hypothetical protein